MKIKQVQQWLSERLKLDLLVGFLSKKEVPRHKHSFWYLFGGLSLFFFLIQIITGMLLLLYYSPTPLTANESVRFINEEVTYGWVIRSIHHWSSHLMIFSMFVHLFSTFFMRAYRAPREMLWISGVLQFFVVLALGFTGYLLPWDDIGYFATQIGTEVARSVPLAGDLLVKLLGVDVYISDESFKRFAALHFTILPIILIVLASLHIILNQVHGTSTPEIVELSNPSYRFYPNFLLRDITTWTISFALLMTLVLLFPKEVGPKADPLSSAPVGIKPEWYFLPLYQTLRLFPSILFGINGEVLVNLFVFFFAILLLLIPFLDKGRVWTKLIRVGGIVALLYIVVMIVLAYITTEQHKSIVQTTSPFPEIGLRIFWLVVVWFISSIPVVLLWLKRKELE